MGQKSGEFQPSRMSKRPYRERKLLKQDVFYDTHFPTLMNHLDLSFSAAHSTHLLFVYISQEIRRRQDSRVGVCEAFLSGIFVLQRHNSGGF